MTHDADPACRRNCGLTAALSGVAVAVFTYTVSDTELLAAVLLGGLVGVGVGGFLRWAFCAGRIAYVMPSPVEPVTPFSPLATPVLPIRAEARAPEAAVMAPVAPVPAAVIDVPASAGPIVVPMPPAEPAVSQEAAAMPPVRSGPFAPFEAESAAPAAPLRRKSRAVTEPAEGVTKTRSSRAGAKSDVAVAAAPAPTRSRAPAKPKTSDRRTEPKPAAPPQPRASGLDFAVNKSKRAIPVAAAPEMLTAPRGGKADDLKEIRGIGPVIESLLNQLGFWHFDQIASWKARDIAYVDERLVGFHGRISRDEWVRQAQVLATGGTTEHASEVRRKDGST